MNDIYFFIILILYSKGLISDEDEEHLLSPAEQRALKAEKRAAWRQARLKSLEQVKVERFYTFINIDNNIMLLSYILK